MLTPSTLVLLITIDSPLVRLGGCSLHDLREDVFDAANNSNLRSKIGLHEAYSTALMGGEPYAVWF